RISGNTDLLQDGENGLLVEPGDATALATALRTLVEDRARARALGDRARASVETRFALPVVLSHLLQAYRTSSR
ncbi:MAG TPA: glycosyltransferase, partial [Burkholderiaceae bacterium]|nr:glycosyltransferase [Burkholderiaceae bacterium]